MIGDDIYVTVVDIRGDKVRLGFDAPRDIPIHRQEIYEEIQRENRKLGPSGGLEGKVPETPEQNPQNQIDSYSQPKDYDKKNKDYNRGD